MDVGDVSWKGRVSGSGFSTSNDSWCGRGSGRLVYGALRRALRLGAVECTVQVAEDGQEAMEYLSGGGKFTDRETHPLPSLILLDLKLPYVHGFEELEWLSTQPALK